MTDILNALVAEAQGLANDHPCTRGHLWEAVGGRTCDRCWDEFGREGSQPVFQCARCGEEEYGNIGDPSYEWCKLNCRH